MLASDVIDRTLNNWIYPGGIQRPAYDTLVNLLGASDPTFVVSGRVNNIPRDSVLEIDYELILVNSVATNTITPQLRGYLESDAASHVAGSIVNIDPTFSRKAILDALAAVIGMLYPAGCYWRNLDQTQTVVASTPTHSLPANGKRLISILASKSNVIEEYQRLRPGIDYLNLSEFSPPKYTLLRGGYSGGGLVVVYAKDFNRPTAPTDDLTAFGLPETLQPHLPMGVAGYLLMGRELPRIQVEEIRRFLASQGIQIGAALNVGQGLLNFFMARHVGSERERLDEQDPIGFEYVRV